jgi:hypothetical protein
VPLPNRLAVFLSQLKARWSPAGLLLFELKPDKKPEAQYICGTFTYLATRAQAKSASQGNPILGQKGFL